MTEEDEDALLEFGAYQTFFAVMISIMASLNMPIEAPCADDDEPSHPEAVTPPPAVSETRSAFPLADLERVDGRHFTAEDEDALLEFGGIFMFFQTVHACIRGIEMVIEGVNGDADDEHYSVVGQRMYQESRSPFANIKRNDGRAMTQEDEDALMEFSHLLAVYQFFVNVINWDVSRGFGIFPAADTSLVDHSVRLAKDAHKPVARKDNQAMSQDDEDALAPYGAFVIIGLMASQMYDAVFGGLVQVPIKTKEMDGKIKRTPSGAELSATLGLTVKKSLGLDNKARKVKIRGLI